jgi:hypothetical protein
MSPIDIDQLTEAELVDLNHRIVERLHFLDQRPGRIVGGRDSVGE